MSKPIQLIGSPASPYTRKMVSLLRYRRIPYSIIWGDPLAQLREWGIAKPKISLLPTFLLPDEAGDLQAVCDSTPIIRRLEAEVQGRSAIPTDPALAFIDYLLEDFADEWCTKYMFHYRWHQAVDADNAGTLLPLNQKIDMGAEQLNQFKPYITDRQVGRLHVVGSNDVTAPVIDASYRRLLAAMELHLEQQPYLLGKRPGVSDFALYGQFTQLVGFDPTPRAIAHEISPRTVAWTGLMEDQCGLDPKDDDWVCVEDSGSGLRAILTEVGRVYPTALLANAVALQAGEKTWEAQIDGCLWTQQAFSYQGKCLQWINERYQSLTAADQSRVDSLLDGTGCEALLL
jgi:glutathione S-transferase